MMPQLPTVLHPLSPVRVPATRAKGHQPRATSGSESKPDIPLWPITYPDLSRGHV